MRLLQALKLLVFLNIQDITVGFDELRNIEPFALQVFAQVFSLIWIQSNPRLEISFSGFVIQKCHFANDQNFLRNEWQSFASIRVERSVYNDPIITGTHR